MLWRGEARAPGGNMPTISLSSSPSSLNHNANSTIWPAQFYFHGSTALKGLGLLYEVPRSHSHTHHHRYDSSGRVIGQSQRPLPDNTQHSQETDIHAHGRIRTRNPSKRTVADRCLILRGRWERRHVQMSLVYFPSLYETFCCVLRWAQCFLYSFEACL
jgi:hypothetical protein